jgi:hypothetical protein
MLLYEFWIGDGTNPLNGNANAEGGAFLKVTTNS